MKHLLIIIASLLQLCAVTVRADEAVMRFYTTNDGLQNNQARQVISIPDERRILVTIEGGFEWFDGRSFHTLNVDRQQTIRIENFFSQTHHITEGRRLWVRDYHRVYLFDTHTLQQLPAKEALKESGLPLQQTQNLFFDTDGDIWLCTKDGDLWHYDWHHKARSIVIPNQDKSNNLCDIVQVADKVFLLYIDGNIVCYDKNQRQCLWRINLGGATAGRRFKALAWDKDHFLLRSDGGLFLFDIKTRKADLLLTDNNIYEFCRDSKGGVWVSGRYLLWHLDSKLSNIVQYNTAINKHNNLKVGSDWMGITTDWQGNLWACKQNEGVGYMADPQEIIVQQMVADSSDNVRSLMVHQGQVFAATTQGIQRYDNNTATWRIINGTGDKAYNTIVKANDGTLWACGSDGVITQLSGTGSYDILRTFDYKQTPNKQSKQPVQHWETEPFCLPIPGSEKLLTVVRHNNVSVLDPASNTIDRLQTRFPQLLKLRHIVAALQLNDGFIIGSQNGFVWFDPKDCSISTKETEELNNNPYSDKCNCMLRDSRGRVWLGTQNGLMQIERRNKRWSIIQYIGKQNGLPSNCILSIIEDAKKNLWVATYTGICCLKTDGGTPRAGIVLRDEDGINCPQLIERSACLCPDGKLLFGSQNGCYSLDVQKAFEKQQSHKPLLLDYSVCDTLKNISLSNLNYLQNKMSFIISTLDYASHQQVQYRYRLTGGRNSQWTVMDGKDGCIYIEYSQLTHGEYHLEVQASIMAQQWSESLMIDIRITPPWWQTWWAWTLYVILIILSTCVATQAYLRAKRQRLEQRQLIEQLMAQLSERNSTETKKTQESSGLLSAKDQAFIDNVNRIINENICNEELDTTFLASKLLISRTSLYRKMKNLLGIGANEYIRKVRLHKAKEMLEKGDHQLLNISGIAAECGFSSMSHFRSCFKDEFGILPGEIGKY